MEAANQGGKPRLRQVSPGESRTVTPAHEVRTKSGKVYKIKRHAQTKAEEASQLEDLRWANGFELWSRLRRPREHLSGTDELDIERYQVALRACHYGWWLHLGKRQPAFRTGEHQGPWLMGEILSYRYGLQGMVY